MFLKSRINSVKYSWPHYWLKIIIIIIFAIIEQPSKCQDQMVPFVKYYSSDLLSFNTLSRLLSCMKTWRNVCPGSTCMCQRSLNPWITPTHTCRSSFFRLESELHVVWFDCMKLYCVHFIICWIYTPKCQFDLGCTSLS